MGERRGARQFEGEEAKVVEGGVRRRRTRAFCCRGRGGGLGGEAPQPARTPPEAGARLVIEEERTEKREGSTKRKSASERYLTAGDDQKHLLP